MTEVFVDVVHWVFAIKYWSLSVKLELIKSGQNVDKNNTLFTIFYVVGIVMNVAAGIFVGSFKLSKSQNVNSILSIVGIFIVLITCFVLIDAYRRFAKSSPTE